MLKESDTFEETAISLKSMATRKFPIKENRTNVSMYLIFVCGLEVVESHDPQHPDGTQRIEGGRQSKWRQIEREK